MSYCDIIFESFDMLQCTFRMSVVCCCLSSARLFKIFSKEIPLKQRKGKHQDKKDSAKLKKKREKMRVLELNRKYLIFLGVCSTSKAISRACFKANHMLVLVLQILGLLAGVWFIVTFIKTDFNGVLYSGFHTSAYSTSTYSLVVGFVHQKKIVAIFQTLQCIYDECTTTKTHHGHLFSFSFFRFFFLCLTTINEISYLVDICNKIANKCFDHF